MKTKRPKTKKKVSITIDAEVYDFLENFEKWCKKRGVKEIRMDEPDKASAFFKKAGYLSIVTDESNTSLLKVL